MSDLTLGSKARKEEEILYTRFVMCEKAQRFLLLEAFERKYHRVLRMDNFEQYCRERLGLTYDHSYLSRIVSAARVERALVGEMFNSLNILDGAKPRLSFKTASEIAKLPEEKWTRVYEEYCLRDTHGNRTPGDLLTELKRIVKREMPTEDKQTAPAPTASTPSSANPAPAIAETHQKPNMTPLVPEVYDTGEEDDVLKEAPPDVASPAVVPAAAPGEAAIISSKGEDPVRAMGICFMKTFDAAMRSGDQNALMELHIDVRKFRKEYGL